jgi:hypothetical protein
MTAAARLAFASALLLVACGGAEPITLGLEEPLRVPDAQFVEGELPGRPPLTAAQIMAGERPRTPYVTSPDTAGRALNPVETGFVISGRASPEAYAIGVLIDRFGTGYWLFPTGSPDPANNDELLWRRAIDFGASLEPGLHHLRLAAIDEQGGAGTQAEFEFCMRSPIPDNLNSCAPTREPPALVVSLSWDNDADLDLRVVTVDGDVIDHDAPKQDPELADSAFFEHDSNAGCVSSGVPRENVVFPTKPPRGTYLVYANLHDACGERAAPFVVTIHVGEEDGAEFRQTEVSRVASEVLRVQANGGSKLGTFITEFHVN